MRIWKKIYCLLYLTYRLLSSYVIFSSNISEDEKSYFCFVGECILVNQMGKSVDKFRILK